MSTRNQKKKAGIAVSESESSLTENFPIVCSVVIGEEADTEASTSTNVSAPQIDLFLESLKTTLRKEITEEVKTLLAQSQRELISAIRSSSLES